MPALRLKGAEGCLEYDCCCFVGLDCAEDVLRSLLDWFHDEFETFEPVSGLLGSFLDFRRNGEFALNGLLEKKPERLLAKVFSGEELMPGI